MEKAGQDSQGGSREGLTYRLDTSVQSDTMMISFAVFPAAGRKSGFDFVRASNPVKAKKLFLRDPHMMWYQKGTPGIADDVPGVVAFLRNAIARERVKRVVTIGNSGGGFSAILFGVLLGADEIHAFNPPTRLRKADDTSYPDQLEGVRRECGDSVPYLDLRNVLREHVRPPTKIFIHYSRGARRDRRHAKYLREFPMVHLIEYPFVSHHVARFFADRDMLTPLLSAAAEGDAQQLQVLTRRMVWAAAPGYIPGRISQFAGKIVSRVVRALQTHLHSGQ